MHSFACDSAVECTQLFACIKQGVRLPILRLFPTSWEPADPRRGPHEDQQIGPQGGLQTDPPAAQQIAQQIAPRGMCSISADADVTCPCSCCRMSACMLLDVRSANFIVLPTAGIQRPTLPCHRSQLSPLRPKQSLNPSTILDFVSIGRRATLGRSLLQKSSGV